MAAAALANLGNLTTQKGEHGGFGDFISVALIALVVAAIVFGWAVPRWQGSPRASLVLAGLSVLSLAAFWAGIPLIIGPGDRHGTGSRRAHDRP